MKDVLAAWLLLFSLIPGGCARPEDAAPSSGPRAVGEVAEIRDVRPVEAGRLIAANPGLYILDVRSDYEYADEHIAGSVLIPVELLEARLTSDDAAPGVHGGRPPRKDEPVLCVCAIGGRSVQAAAVLARMGYRKPMNLVGGIKAWKSAGLPLEGPPPPPRAPSAPAP